MTNFMICNSASTQMHHLNESDSAGKKYVLEGEFARLGELNRNQRIYTEEEYLKHLSYLRDDIKSGDGLLGELDHPDDRFEVKLKEASHKVIDLWYDKSKHAIMGKIELLDTPNGKIAKALVDDGIPLHISSRAAGTVDPNTNVVEIQQIYTYDLVAKPGFASAVLHRVDESVNNNYYSENTKTFLRRNEIMEARNLAQQFGMPEDEVGITPMPVGPKLRKEARRIAEEPAITSLFTNTNDDESFENFATNDYFTLPDFKKRSVRLSQLDSDDIPCIIDGTKLSSEDLGNPAIIDLKDTPSVILKNKDNTGIFIYFGNLDNLLLPELTDADKTNIRQNLSTKYSLSPNNINIADKTGYYNDHISFDDDLNTDNIDVDTIGEDTDINMNRNYNTIMNNKKKLNKNIRNRMIKESSSDSNVAKERREEDLIRALRDYKASLNGKEASYSELQSFGKEWMKNHPLSDYENTDEAWNREDLKPGTPGNKQVAALLDAIHKFEQKHPRSSREEIHDYANQWLTEHPVKAFEDNEQTDASNGQKPNQPNQQQNQQQGQQQKESTVNEDGDNDDVDNSDNNDNSDSEDTGVEIIDVKVITSDDSDDNSDEDSKEDSDDQVKKDNDEVEECEDEDTNECGKCRQCSADKQEIKVTASNKLNDSTKSKIRKDKNDFLNKISNLTAAIEKKNKLAKECKNESQIMAQYPVSMMLNESNFARFLSLSESQKTKVATYLKNNAITDPRTINEQWTNGLITNEEPVWLTFAPAEYRRLYESASAGVKASLANTAEYVLFEDQQDINTFWENSGLERMEENRLLNESFVNNMPKIAVNTQPEYLPYGHGFIQQIADMACEYN